MKFGLYRSFSIGIVDAKIGKFVSFQPRFMENCLQYNKKDLFFQKTKIDLWKNKYILRHFCCNKNFSSKTA